MIGFPKRSTQGHTNYNSTSLKSTISCYEKCGLQVALLVLLGQKNAGGCDKLSMWFLGNVLLGRAGR
jgi:hypothetical protein